ncbi:proline iminopeptidase-family hydrolase [Novosphingobium kaempferiae]|uniref:proline iminopeptidase-family hydrolase n=1 Tax=Novosphingobium kaempferiae TaxID=2896849 RepID=UPI001E2C96FA|nr:proline iminopeptidase-family hydrolase [Novosphingobium kaempferiae]
MDIVTPSPHRLDRREFVSVGALAALLAAAPARAAAAPSGAAAQDGVRWITLDNGHKVWTQRVGSGKTKVLLLHGGPGFSHDYLQCFADYLPQAGYELYFYDQLGCGLSDRPEDTSLWTLPRYLDELEQVRTALGLETFVLYGHSWGGILGTEYALRHPERLSGLVISNMSASIADYVSYIAKLRSSLPEAARKELDRLEAAGQSESEAYTAIVERELYPRYILRLDPHPEPVLKAFTAVNPVIYRQMAGPNEFVFSGNLEGWDRWADLPRIQTPTLVMGARYDEMDPASMKRQAEMLPHGSLFISEKGSHLSMWDDQRAYFQALLKFLGTIRA